jgi:TolB-like protein/Flp pilus assembly protein TadD
MEARAGRVYEFGPFRLEPAERRLLREGTPIVLTAKVLDLLIALVERAGHLVSKEELLSRVWPDSFVEEANLSVNISALRRAIGDVHQDSGKYIETIPRVGYRFVAPVQEAAAGEPDIHSIAVLPLANLSADPAAQEYFTDGLTEELITELAKISRLRVISRTSAMHFKSTSKTVPEIARELSVDAVVEGAVVRDGNRVRISAQLIDARTDLHLWAQSYEGDLSDVLRLQDQVAWAIANEIKGKLAPLHQGPNRASVRAVSSEVHELYLKGRFHWNKRTEDGLKKSIEYFQQAIEGAPLYALAYSALADSYNMLGLWSVVPHTEVAPKAKAAATKALEIDDQLAEAHASLGWSRFAFDWDWVDAEEELKRAIKLNPGYESAHRWLCNCLQQQGRLDEASVEIKVAKELDPLSLVNNTVLGQNLYFLRKYDQAIEQERKTLEIDNFAYAHYVLGSAYEQKGDLGKAILEFQKAATLNPNPVYPAGLGHAFALAGRRMEARKLLDELSTLSRERNIAWNEIAVICVGLGEKDKALVALETAYKRHSSQLNWLKVDPRFDHLHNDPRFQDVLRRMNLQC